VFNGTFNFVLSFSDPGIPKGFAPYGIQAINGQIWVTFTALNKAQGGFVDVVRYGGDFSQTLCGPWSSSFALGYCAGSG